MKIYLEVYGCTANKSDASLIKGLITENNHSLVKEIKDADSIVILTCTVIDTTEQRMISRLKNFKNIGKSVIVAGCMASIQEDKVKDILPDAQLLPPQYSHHIVNVLEKQEIKFKEENKTHFSKKYEDVFAPISIAEGCMFSCSYCITSLARGKLKSYPISEIKKDIENALNNGCKEIQITSQDTSSYGLDNNTNLGDLIKEISKIDGKFRVRIGMMNPYTCFKNINSIIDGFVNSNIYRFIHLPVQSGNDEILEKMNRKYTVDDYKKIIKRFRVKYSDITLSTDVIVGFPTETEGQFHNTINLIENIKPDITNITRFSARPHTKAKTMKGRIKTEVVKKRSKTLTDLCSKISKQKNEKYIGNKYNILITELGKKNTYVGRSENYKPVVVKKKVKIGEFRDVEIVDSGPTYLVGSLI